MIVYTRSLLSQPYSAFAGLILLSQEIGIFDQKWDLEKSPSPLLFPSPILKKNYDADDGDKLSRGQTLCHKFYEIQSIMNVAKYI